VLFINDCRGYQSDGILVVIGTVLDLVASASSREARAEQVPLQNAASSTNLLIGETRIGPHYGPSVWMSRG
jgi:hypothetical protein